MYEYAMRLGLTAEQIREDFGKMLAPHVMVDSMHLHFPDEDDSFHEVFSKLFCHET